MKKGWKVWGRLAVGCACLLFPLSTALAAQDPCLSLALACATNGQVQLALHGTSGVTYVLETSPDLQNWTPVVTNSDASNTRLLTFDVIDSGGFFRASSSQLSPTTGAIVAINNVNFSGNNITVDSYDSSLGPYDTVTNRSANGDVSSIVGVINVQNANIYGHIRTGPNGAFSIGPSGIVGDLDWTGPGIEPGWYDNNFQPCIPDVVPPYNPTNSTPPPMTLSNRYTLWFLGSSHYAVSDLTMHAGDQMNVLGNATLYITGNLIMNSSGNNVSSINIFPGASLKLYVGGTNAVLQQVNAAGPASTFQFFGLPGNTSLTWQGNATFTGCVYAPEAAFTMSGGGIYQGACVVNSVALIGQFSFHYDENLSRVGPTR